LRLWPDVHLQGMPVRERTAVGEPRGHAETDFLAVVGGVCMMLARGPHCRTDARLERT